MKILVTGAGGFLGTALVGRLLAQGFTDIRCMVRSRKDPSWSERWRAQYPNANLEILTGNLLRPQDAAHAVDGVDLIYHVAAALRGPWADMVQNSVVGSRRLLEALNGRKPRIVLVSTFSVYGVAGMPSGALLNEESPLETHPELRDPYTLSKLWQERLFREYQQKLGFELVVVRPGVLYGEGSGALSGRVGQSMFGFFLHLGHGNILPLNQVDNCAEALIVAASKPEAANQTYNVCDDDLPTCGQYLSQYRKHVQPLRVLPVPYSVLLLMSWAVEKYHVWSRGQLPAAFNIYLAKTLWKGTRFDNSKLKSLGWRPVISTAEGLKRSFAYHRAKLG